VRDEQAVVERFDAVAAACAFLDGRGEALMTET
jgi:hypothetical protein